MSNTDYEKKYNEALERAKRWADGTLQPEHTTPQGVCEAIFPELCESEDEKIRKEMIRHFQNILKGGVDTTTLEDTKRWLAWLEKQKDSIPYEKYVMDIAAMSAEMRTKYSAGWNAGYETKQKEQKPIPLMNGDADLYFDNLRMATQHVLTSREWFEEGIKYAQKLQKEPETASASSIPSCWEEKQKEQQPMDIAPNQFDGITYGMQGHSTENLAERSEEDEKFRPRKLPHWKPSEEQIEAFENCLESIPNKYFDDMCELYADLKKLMED